MLDRPLEAGVEGLPQEKRVSLHEYFYSGVVTKPPLEVIDTTLVFSVRGSTSLF